jgi:hypothetical protein
MFISSISVLQFLEKWPLVATPIGYFGFKDTTDEQIHINGFSNASSI